MVNINRGRVVMDKRKAIEAGDKGVPKHDGAPEELKIELPFVVSPGFNDCVPVTLLRGPPGPPGPCARMP